MRDGVRLRNGSRFRDEARRRGSGMGQSHRWDERLGWRREAQEYVRMCAFTW